MNLTNIFFSFLIDLLFIPSESPIHYLEEIVCFSIAIITRTMMLFDDIWYQIFHFLCLSDINNVLRTNKHFFSIAIHQVKISEELTKIWYQSHQLLLKNLNVHQKTKTLKNYKFVLDHERGLKLGFKQNKYRNSLSFCVISYWGRMKRWKISFAQKRFISVHYSGLHKHSSSNDIYHVHIFDYNDRHLIHFFEVLIDLRFLSHIRVGFKFVRNSIITSMGCKCDFQNRFSVHSSSFSYDKTVFEINEIILGTRYNSHHQKALFICKRGCYLFCAQLGKLFCFLNDDLKIDSSTIYFDSPNENTITISKGSIFIIYQKVGDQWKSTKHHNIDHKDCADSTEQTFRKYCPISDRILLF